MSELKIHHFWQPCIGETKISKRARPSEDLVRHKKIEISPELSLCEIHYCLYFEIKRRRNVKFSKDCTNMKLLKWDIPFCINSIKNCIVNYNLSCIKYLKV